MNILSHLGLSVVRQVTSGRVVASLPSFNRTPRFYWCLVSVVLIACRDQGEQVDPEDETSQAVVTAVTTQGSDGNYDFTVTLQSPDTGCDQYADWWEVLTLEGELIYRRILTHSHVDEQPFTRSGGPVNIKPRDTVFIRGHMNNSGYGTSVFTGCIQTGFTAMEVDTPFATRLADQEPLPGPCPF